MNTQEKGICQLYFLTLAPCNLNEAFLGTQKSKKRGIILKTPQAMLSNIFMSWVTFDDKKMGILWDKLSLIRI